jgi:hypothetical protein
VCLICPQALAWEYIEVDDGDSSYPPEVPVRSAIRNWGPSDKVLILSEWKRDFNFDDDQRLLTLYGFTCSNNNDCATVTNGPIVQPTVELRFDTPFLTSLAIGRESANDPIVLSAVLRRKIETDCDGDNTEYDELLSTEDQDPDALNRDLGEIVFEWDSWLAITEENDIDVPVGFCRDHEVSFTRMRNGFPVSCWTIVTNVGEKLVTCSQRSAFFPWTASFTIEGQDPYTTAVENPWFDFRYSTSNFVAVHNDLDTKTQVYVDGNTNYVDFPALEDDTNWPTVDIEGAGAIHVAWSDHNVATGGVTFEYSRCPSTEDCLDETDWVAGHVDFPNDRQHEVSFGILASHPQLAIDGKKQFILGMADQPGGTQDFGVYLFERCGTEDWTYELVKPLLNIDNDQHIDNGVPNIVLNQQERIVHVVFVENDNIHDPTEGHVFWARKSYSACP